MHTYSRTYRLPLALAGLLGPSKSTMTWRHGKNALAVRTPVGGLVARLRKSKHVQLRPTQNPIS